MDPFIGQIQAFGFDFAPQGWAKCDGALLPISQYQALFSLIGTRYGGDGRTTFGLPDLRGRVPMNYGTGPGLTTRIMGQKGGYEHEVLSPSQMPAHTHTLTNGNANVTVYTTNNSNDSADTDNGSNGLGTSGNMPEIYRESPTAGDKLAGVVISGQTDPMGGSNPINTMQPYLVVNYCIALVGIFPPRS